VPFVTAADVQTLHDAITAEVTDLGNAVARATMLDAQTVNEWHSIRERAIAYLADAPSTLRAAAQMNAGEQLQRDLGPWHARLLAAGAHVGPAPSGPPAQADFFSSLGKDIEWVVLGFLALQLWQTRR
jgi:hypothetical protein